MTAQTVQNISLASLCQEQGQPFQWLARGDHENPRAVQSLFDLKIEPFYAADMYCGRVRDAVVFGKSYVCDRPGRAVFLNQSHRNYDAKEFAAYYRRDIHKEARPRPLVTGECCFLGGFSGDVRFFGHFIFEFLYRLAAFDMCGLLGRFPVVVFDDVPEPWLSYVELYGVPRDRIVRVPQYPSPRFESVWVTSCPNFTASDGFRYAFWEDGIRAVRAQLVHKAATPGSPGLKRVFLGRRDAPHRKLVNEAEVWRILEPLGFAYPDFVGKSAAEQIRAVAAAEIIVSVTGSGGSMTQFAPKDCAILDIVGSNIVGGLGSKGFAAVIGQMYTRVPSMAVAREGGLAIDSDIEVDIDALEQYVNLTIEHANKAAENPKQ
jgi:capsular polysaccharide biosynthesis protein